MAQEEEAQAQQVEGGGLAIVPSEISAGMTVSIEVNLIERPAPDWALALILRGPSAIDLASGSDGSAHVISAAADVTATWTPGRYSYQLRAVRDPDVILVERGELMIAVDLDAAPAGHDGRSHARRVLEAIEAVIEGRASIDQSSYQINNRSLSRTPIGDLLKLRTQYRAEVQAEDRRGAGYGRQIKVRFS